MTDPRKDLPPVNSPNFLEKVREALGTYLGNRGNALDRGVTLRDLAESGFATLRPNFGSGSGSPIGGPGSLIVDNIVYEPDLTPPPTPTGFTASAAISNLLLECDPQTYTQGHGHAKSRLHGVTWSSGPLPVFADAQPITEFQGTVASHATNPSTTWHLWLTWVTVDGEESTSPAGGTNGVVTRTGEDVALLLDALAGEVTSTELHTTLGSRIDLIDGPTTLAGSVAKRILDETNSRVAALLAESSARAAALTTEATNRTNAIQNEAGIRANAILTEALARENGDSTIQSQVNLLTAASSGDLTDLIAAVNTEQTARIAADAAEALSRETLATQMRGAYNGTDIAQITTGLIHSERLARSDADGAIVTSVSTLSATVADNLTTVNSAITSEASTRANADTAEATNRNTLTTKMIGAANPATATLGSLTSGLLYDETSARSTADSTEVTARQLLSSTMLGSIDPTGKTLGNVTSGIIFDERTTRATAVSGLATRTDTLEASVNSGTTGLATKASSASVTSAVATETTARVNAVNALTTSLGTTNTAITSEQDARSTADTALALRATNLEASVNNATTGLASKASVGYVDTAKVDAISAAASASQVLVSSIKVGGNNLMRNSGHWTSSSTPWSSNGSTVSMDATVPWGEYNSMKLVGSGGALAPTIMRLKPNTQYTVSAMVKGSAALAGASDSNLHIQSWTDESSGNVHQEGSVAYSQDITTSWKLVYQTFITPASATLTYCRMYFYPLAAGFTLNVGYVKLEEGNVATDWTPAPEDTDTKISTVNATLVNDYSTTATMNSAISTATTALASTVGSNLSTALTSYRTAASQDTVTATAIANVSARLDSGGDTYQAIANTATSVSTKSATFAQSTTPTATKAGDLWIDTSDSNKLKQWNGGTWVYADDQRIGSTASSVTTLQSQMTGATGSTLLSSIQTEATTRATQTGELYAQYTVKLDVGGLVSGYGIASSGINGPGSAFGIRADRFWVAAPAIVSEDAPTTNLFLGKSYYKPSWDKTLYLTEYTPGVSQSWMTNNQIEAGGVPPPFSPFVIQATPTTINGVNVPAGIYANDAYIKNGTITNAKIANLAVDDAKIATLNVSKLTAGTLKVGSYIESSDYTSGPTGVGYRIDRDAVVLPATSIRGVLTADQINTDGLEIWNADHSQLILGSGSSLQTQLFGTGGKITSATASTYIADLAVNALQVANGAITTAKIGNAQITTALIGNAQITSLKIGLDEVTVPRGYYSSSTSTISNSSGYPGNDVHSGYINSNGSPVIIVASLTLNGTAGSLITDAFLELKSPSGNFISSAHFQSPYGSYVTTLTAVGLSTEVGTYVLNVTAISGSGSTYVYRKSLVLMGAKR